MCRSCLSSTISVFASTRDSFFVLAFACVAFAMLTPGYPLRGQDAVAPSSNTLSEGGTPPMTAKEMENMQRYLAISWQKGPTKVSVGPIGEIQVPDGYEYAADADARTLLELYGNPRNPNILGALRSQSENADWTLIFKFDAIGYVNDADKDSIDANEILSSFQAGLPEMNQLRRQMGLSECRSITWMEQPFYDTQTNNLTWALNLGFPEGNSVNYDIRMLGRRGVMEATLLGDPATYGQAVPEVKRLLSGYAFTPGNKYSEWVQGDKVAAYGLTGLVAGGGIAAAAKTGLLAKLALLFTKGGKAGYAAIVAVIGGIYAFFKRLVGGGRGETMTD